MVGRWWRCGSAAIGVVIACGSPCAAGDPDNPLFVPLAEESHS